MSAEQVANLNLYRRNREIYEVWRQLRSRRSHSSEYVIGWIMHNYFVSEDTIYRILRGFYGSMDEPFDNTNASTIYKIAMSDEYHRHGPVRDYF